MEFKDWITKKYIDWRGDAIGNEKSITDFAEYIGTSQSLLNQWMSGAKKPGRKTIPGIAKRYPDVYDALGLSNSSASFAILNSLPEELQDILESALLEAHKKASESGTPLTSPEGKRILRESLSRRIV